MSLYSPFTARKANPAPMINPHATARNLTLNLGGDWNGTVGRCPAPGKGPSNRSLVIMPNHNASGGVAVHDHSGQLDQRDCLALKDHWVRCGWLPDTFGKGGQRQTIKPLTQSEIQAQADRQVRKHAIGQRRAKVFWQEAQPLLGSVAQMYLQSRGIWFPDWSASLRCHPALDYWQDGKILFTSPAMVAKIVNNETGASQGVHVTYLSQDGAKHSGAGKATRKIFGQAKSGCVRLDSARDYSPTVRAVSEGIESALSFSVKRLVTCDASLNANNMKHYLPPTGREFDGVLIGHDVDKNGVGQKAGQVLSERLKAGGLESVLCPPPAPHGDWNDALRSSY